MRSDEELERGRTALDNRIERDVKHIREDDGNSLALIVVTIWQAKREGLEFVANDEHGEHWEVFDQLHADVQKDLPLKEYVQVQAMTNALAWAHGDLDSL